MADPMAERLTRSRERWERDQFDANEGTIPLPANALAGHARRRFYDDLAQTVVDQASQRIGQPTTRALSFHDTANDWVYGRAPGGFFYQGDAFRPDPSIGISEGYLRPALGSTEGFLNLVHAGRHEVGHAVDASSGLASQSRAFSEALRSLPAGSAAGRIRDQQASRTDHGAVPAPEAYAEIAATYRYLEDVPPVLQQFYEGRLPQRTASQRRLHEVYG